jgi:hypothetical protein
LISWSRSGSLGTLLRRMKIQNSNVNVHLRSRIAQHGHMEPFGLHGVLCNSPPISYGGNDAATPVTYDRCCDSDQRRQSSAEWYEHAGKRNSRQKTTETDSDAKIDAENRQLEGKVKSTCKGCDKSSEPIPLRCRLKVHLFRTLRVILARFLIVAAFYEKPEALTTVQRLVQRGRSVTQRSGGSRFGGWPSGGSLVIAAPSL